MSQQVYECFFIFDANRYNRDPSGVAGKIAESVEKCGGEVLASRLWNEQKLAYPIRKQRKGVYWLTYVKLESTAGSQLEREFQLNDNILRHMKIKVHPQLVDTLVAVARGEALPAAEEEEPAAEANTEETAETTAS